MQKITTAIFAFALALGAMAQVSQPATKLQTGFCRVQNYKTGRYAYICDNTGKAVINTTSYDMGAVALYQVNARDRFSDPASVVYVEPVAHKHNIFSQNTSFYEIAGNHYVQIQDGITAEDGTPTFKITPLYAGTDYYVIDNNSGTSENTQNYRSKADAKDMKSITGSSENAMYWIQHPVSEESDEYLGIESSEEMKVGDKYYKPYIIGFPISFANPTTKAYYVTKTDKGEYVMKAIKGIVPANTPIIIESTTSHASENRVILHSPYEVNLPGCITDNVLVGQYFCYDSHGTTAYKLFSSSTMRVLAVKDGQLTFTNDIDEEGNVHTTLMKVDPYTRKPALLANSCYLSVADGTPASLALAIESGSTLENYVEKYRSDMSHIVRMMLQPDKADPAVADFNDDGLVTIKDLVILIDRLKK